MIEDTDFEVYLYISSDKFSISAFTKSDSKTIYFREHLLNSNKTQINQQELEDFISQNIFSVEKSLNQFVKNIYLILNTDQFFEINFGIKKYNSHSNINSAKERIELLHQIKNEIKKNYLNTEIIHFVITKYIFDNVISSDYIENQVCSNFCLETKLICIKNQDILFFDKILRKYQILLKKIISNKYALSLILDKKISECEMGFKIINGYNKNEVLLLPKNVENKGIFEKFFDLFG